MFVTDHPAWADCKAYLSRITEAGVRLTEAQAGNDALELAQAEQELLKALQAYDCARERMASAASAGLDGIVLPSMPHPEPSSMGRGIFQCKYQPGMMQSLHGPEDASGPRQMQQGGGDQDG